MPGTKTAPDWESIEGEYRAGALSVRKIGERYGVSHVAIAKRAERDGWARAAKKAAAVSTPVSAVTTRDVGNHANVPVTIPLAEGDLNPKQVRFVDEYMKDRNATQAYIRAGYSPNGANRNSAVLMAKHDVSAEIARRVEEYSRCAGIERVALLEVCKRAVFADPRKAFDERGNVLPPQQWPDELIGAIAGYKGAGEKTPEEIKFHDQPALALKLLDEIRPPGERADASLRAGFAALLEAAIARAGTTINGSAQRVIDAG